MIKLKDVVWGEVELVEEDDTNAGGGSVSVMTCCGYPPPYEGLRCGVYPPHLGKSCNYGNN